MEPNTENTFSLEGLRGPLAFLADIHGNLKALDAVLAELRTANAAAIFVAGDLVFGGDDPLGVWKRLLDVGARCVRGTTDLAVATLDPAKLHPRDPREEARVKTLVDTRAALGELILARLRRLPEAIRVTVPNGDEWLVVHGSPRDPDEAMTHDLDDDELLAMLGDESARLVVCGSSHVPFERTVDDVKIVGVGSVGESPEGGIAHFTLIRPTVDGPQVDARWVAY